MAFIDEIKFNVETGRGGDGVVRWRQEKFVPKGGPSGGDGGNGGDVYAVATRELYHLEHYREKRNLRAGDGEPGGSKSLTGANGDDLTLKFPVGTVLTDLERDISYDLMDEKPILILKGGRGGIGNERFKSSINQTPMESTKGYEGEGADFHAELRLIADVGLVGYPNAGKSSLLNSLTNAGAKIGDYPFTTLDPNLGSMYGIIIADIPGLIEGAAEGKGLGHKFLRHIRRTKLLLHLVSFENPNMMKAYDSIRTELGDFDPTLLEKDELIVLSKTDMTEPEKVEKELEKFSKLGKTVIAITLFEEESVKKLKKIIEEKVKG